jgi:hypothetical protein
MLLALSLFLFHGQAAAQASTMDPQQIQQIVTRAVTLHKKWGAPMNPAGVSTEIKEVYRRPGNGQTAVAYHVYVRGLPDSKNYTLIQMNVATGKITPSMQGVTLGKDGLAVCAGRPTTCGDPAMPDDPIDFILPSEKGEPHHLALVSEDGMSKVFFLITPFPVVTDDHGCTLELVRLLPQAAVVYARAAGFAPNEKLSFESASEIESHNQMVTATADGVYDTALLPAVKGIESGQFRVTVRGKSCSPTATMDWGPASDHNE